MDELTLATIDSPDCRVSEHIAILMASGDAPEIDIESRVVDGFSEALELLEEGELDMVALPATMLHGKQAEMLAAGCEVVGARAPRRPNLILVSENKITYQPKSAFILAEHKNVRRQLRRARRGLRVLGPVAYAAISELDGPPSDPLLLTEWMEDLRQNGEIDGYITSRAIYDELEIGGRRHALLPDPKDRGGAHFLPLPYADLVILMARRRFPNSITEQIAEPEGNTSWWVQDQLISGLSEDMLERTAVLVRHRHVRSLMKQAEEHKDIALEQSCHDTEGEVLDDDVHVEIRLEVVSKDGHRSLGLDRLIGHAEYQYATISMLRDWEVLVREASRPVPKDFYTDIEAPVYIDLDE